MDLQKVAAEIGLFETGLNLARFRSSEDVRQRAGASLPLPEEDLESKIEQLTNWLLVFGKRKYLFLSPEIALTEALAKRTEASESIFILSSNLDAEAKERIRNNLPRSMEVSTLEEPFFPDAVFPRNALIVVSGFLAGEKTMVLPESYRMAVHYRQFLGKMVFVPYTETDGAVAYEGWRQADRQLWDGIWRRTQHEETA